MFEYDGDQYTLQELQDSAKSQSIDFKNFMTTMQGKGMTEIKPTKEVEMPNKASTVLSNLGLGFFEFAQGIERQKEAIQLGITELLMPGEMSVEEKKGARQAIKLINLGSSDSYEPIIEKLEQNIPEYETQSITEDLLNGNYSQAGFRTVNAALRSAPSLIAAATGVGGLVALAGSVAGNKFEEEFEADPTKSTGLLLANAGLTGATEATFELVTRGLLKKAGFLRGQGNIKAAKELLQGGAKNIIKNIAYGIGAEGASEAATELTVALEDRLTLGKKIDKDLLYRLGDSFIVGSFIGGGISTVGELGNTNKLAKQRAEAILMPEDIKQDINKKVEQLNELFKDLPNASKEGKSIVEDQINTLEQDIISQKQKSSKIVNSLKGKDLQNYFNNVSEINKQKDIIKKANTESETKLAKNKIKELIKNNNSIIQEVATKQTAQVTETVKQQIKQSGLDGKVTELSSEEISNIKEEGFDSKEASKQYGFISQRTDGSFEIFLNKDKPMVGTAAHEFMHAVLYKTIKGNSKLQSNLGNALTSFINDKKGGVSQAFIDRMAPYVNDSNFGEETITIMSESIIDGNLKYNEGFFTKIGDVLRRGLQNVGLKKIKFDTGRDVYNFIKDYSKNIKDGKISSAILKVAKEGAKGKLVEGNVDAKATVQSSKEASDKVQSIYENEGAAGAFDIINEFKPIVGKIVDKRRDAPNFDRELLTSEIEIGKRGILDLISEYKPESGVPLAAFINKFLPARAIEASRRVLGEEFTEDVSERVDIAAEEVAETDVQAKPKKKKIVIADRLNIVKEVEKAVSKIIPDLDLKEITFKNLKNKVPQIVGDLFGITSKKLTTNANITKKELQSAQMFINKNADLLISMLPEGSTTGGTATGVPNSLLKAFYTKTDRAKAVKTGSKAGLAIQQKNNIDKKYFLETFGIIDGKPDRTDRNTSARVLALANTLGKMITNQAVRQQVQTENLRALKDGKSSIMFSKDKELAEKNGANYYNTLDNTGSETYVVDLVEKIIPMFEKSMPGFLNATVAITTSTMPYRLVKDAKSMLASYMGVKGVEFQNNKKYARTKFNTKLVNTKSDKEIQELNKRNVDSFNSMWFTIYDGVQNDKTIITPLLHWLSGSVNEGTHPQRLGAELTHVDRAVKGKLYFEHALQNSNAYRLLMDAAINQNKKEFTKTLEALQKNYKLIAISAKDNTKINKAGYGLLMPEGWNIFDNNWWERYFNDKIAALGGIDPENLKSIGSDKSLGQELNIGVDGQAKNIKSNLKQNQKLNNSIEKARKISYSKEPKGITVLDFDDTLATSKSLIKYTQPDGTKGTLTPEQYASTYQDLQDLGYKFDFSEFNKVVDGKVAPLFQKALKLQSKFGPENMFVLTARPAESAPAIFAFIKANGLNIPLKNITGLANSTAEAKALWIADKVGEGYNDFYFADDALQNVQAVDNMLEQFDVKRKVQQAKIQFSKDMNESFNDILEDVTGIESVKRFDFIKARKRGADKGKFRYFIPPSHEDFVGLLYNFMGKGRKGDAHRNFLEEALVRPLNRANKEYDTARQSIATDYKNLNNQFPEVKQKLINKTPDGDFTYQDAVRIYLWDKHGHNIPGLSPVDQANLVELVKADTKLQSYADAINIISKQETYVNPTEGWNSGDIRMDLDDATGRVGRAQFFEEFQENSDIIFSTENLNKIEAGFGNGVKEALEDILYRVKTGRNRPSGQNELVNKFMNYLNGSVGSVMFFNMRSALLQQMSIVNYINFAQNNIFAAAKAFANQPQYWKDFAFIFNSDMLKQRRGGIQTDVNGAELAASIRSSKNPSRFLISKLLEIGFLPTQIGDNIAIATGGATYYRNTINSYIKQGLSKKEAETKAFTDFQDITQSTQQSARPDMVSQQQASVLGKVILNFQNVTSQFNRLGKKAFLDIKNRRISKPNKTQMQSDISNAARITYYFAVQNAIFYTLQTALFAMMFGDDEDDENKLFIKKKERLINGSIDSVLRGSGVLGGVIATLKNVAIAFARQRDVKYNPDESAVILEALNLSPVLGIKARKIVNAEKTLNYNKKVMKEMETFDIDNPQWSAVTSYVEGFTNLPLNRLYNKTQNIRQGLNNDHANWERTLMFLGWSQYNLSITNEKMDAIKQKIKSRGQKGKKGQYRK